MSDKDDSCSGVVMGILSAVPLAIVLWVILFLAFG